MRGKALRVARPAQSRRQNSGLTKPKFTEFLGLLFDRVDLIKPVSNVRAYVRPPVVHEMFLPFQ